ncbi:MAG TPA: response regulator [Polyangia bacterium]
MRAPRSGDKTDPRPSIGLSILLADDDANLRSMLAIVLRRDGHRVQEFRNGGDLQSHLLATYVPGQPVPREILMILDLRMPEVDGLSLVRSLRQRGQTPPFILLTAFGGAQVVTAAETLGALGVLDKPFDFDDLRTLVRGHARSQLSA